MLYSLPEPRSLLGSAKSPPRSCWTDVRQLQVTADSYWTSVATVRAAAHPPHRGPWRELPTPAHSRKQRGQYGSRGFAHAIHGGIRGRPIATIH